MDLREVDAAIKMGKANQALQVAGASMDKDVRPWCGSGGLKPTPVRASLAQNKKLTPHYAVKRKPIPSAVGPALQMTGFLLTA